ncbi:MAG: pyridoxamine 5'-phosphate oxidase family protein [Acidimicrobiia bacterium]
MKEQKRGRKIAMTPEELDGYLGGERTCTAATIGPDGSPHATALWFVWDGSNMWLYSITRAQRWADLMRDPRIALLVEAGDDYFDLRGVEIRGRVEPVGPVPRVGEEPHEADAVLAGPEALWAAKYQGGAAQMIHDGAHAWLRVVPEKISSWDFRKIGSL